MFDQSNNTGSIDVKMDGSVLEEKSCFKMLGLTFSSKTVSKKIGTLIHSMKFLSPEVALYLYKSTIHPCIKYCCHLWAGTPSCYLELLDSIVGTPCLLLYSSVQSHLLHVGVCVCGGG